jgi:23S rRNA pseudouridine1911/1915/1917 synthase
MLMVPNATRNKIQNAASNGDIYVNDVPVKSNYKVKPLDVIRILLAHPPFENRVDPEDIPLDIVYEDDALLLINKPPNFVVHPGHGNYTGTLVNALAFHFENLPLNSSERPGLVHRIDKDTSGLLVVAKTEVAMTHLAKQFEDKTSEREYIALVWGNVKEDEGTITGNIARHLKDRMQMAVFSDPEIGKHAVTHYKVLERFGYVTLISCKLETGRTHQIRVHLKHIGHTLFNDERYGGNLILKGTTFTKYKQFIDNCFKTLPRQALHAKTLGFVHPTTGKNMLFNTEIPKDMADCIEKWRVYSKSIGTEEE